MATKGGSMSLISFLIFTVFFCIGGLDTSLIAGANTIGIGDELNSSMQLVSQDGRFTLGFFTLRCTKYYSYVGIRYTYDDEAKKLWVANPNTPILNTSGVVLSIDGTGILKITQSGSTIVNISNQVGTGNVSATLDNSGNFIVMDEKEKQILWQSFDHPTDTLISEMKLGQNLRTGQNWSLTSWLTYCDPSSGAFILSWEWEPTKESGQLVIYRRGQVYWKSGMLRNQSFEFMPELNAGAMDKYNFSYISNNEETSLTIYTADGGIRNIPRWALTPYGRIMFACNSYSISNIDDDFCYGYESDNGCAKSIVPECRNPNIKFESFEGDRPPDLVQTNDDNKSISLGDCMERCWKNCTCVGFITSDVYVEGAGCVFWTRNLDFEKNKTSDYRTMYRLVSQNSNQGSPTPPYVPGSENSPKGIKWIITAVAISLFVLLVYLSCYLGMRKLRIKDEEKKRRQKYLCELTTLDSFNNGNDVEKENMEGHDLKILNFASIVAATNNFSDENKLGQGGFGPVYKGRLSEGQEIAIKRLSKTSWQGVMEFKNELIFIAKLQHINLVRILGCCIHGEEMMLIYEYMPNKSLDFFLFDSTKKELLDWGKCLKIVEGIAQGLLYLHNYSRMKVIHRDLKASNILLDENMNPKISDFGMARIFRQNEIEAITDRIVGTCGYMSPEYAMEGKFSIKSDVFSFGVLILEIVSGRRNTNFHHLDLDRPLNLIGQAWELWNEGIAKELKDPTLGDSCGGYQLLRIIHVGFLCIQESAMDRPTMPEVISMLSNKTMPLPTPKQPAFFTGRSMAKSNSKLYSLNQLSISTIEAR